MKKITSLLLILCMLLAFASCKPGDPNADVTTEPDITDQPTVSTTEEVTTADPLKFPAEDPQREIVLFENNKWNYKLVRPDVMNEVVSTTLATARYNLSLASKIGIGVASDHLEEGASYDDGACEILYGNTGHLQSLSAYNSLCFGEAGVFVIGNKIVMAAYTVAGFKQCYLHMAAVLQESFKDGKITAKVSDIEKVFNVDESLSDIPRPDRLNLLTIQDCQYEQTMYIFEKATENDFLKYKEKFAGTAPVQERSVQGNHFATYQIGKHLVNISYSKYDNRIRTILNENNTVSPLMTENTGSEKKTDNIIIMHGLGWGTSESDILSHQNGICILFRLSDGRFLVVDGGFNRQGDADDLYKLLVKYTPSGMKPTVAAWFITHAHGDHHATFANKFVNSYKAAVNIESLLFNPPSKASDVNTSNERTGEELIISVAKGINGCKWIRPHVGDRYYIGDAVVDFYYTIDQYYPQTFTYYNTCSLMFSVTLGGQKTMINGDAANASFREAIRMFGDELKADIVQVAHHGYGTGVSDSMSTDVMQGYKYMSPTLILWPLGNEHYENLSKKVYNKYLTLLPSVKEIKIAGKTDHVVSLPYTPPEK